MLDQQDLPSTEEPTQTTVEPVANPTPEPEQAPAAPSYRTDMHLLLLDPADQHIIAEFHDEEIGPLCQKVLGMLPLIPAGEALAPSVWIPSSLLAFIADAEDKLDTMQHAALAVTPVQITKRDIDMTDADRADTATKTYFTRDDQQMVSWTSIPTPPSPSPEVNILKTGLARFQTFVTLGLEKSALLCNLNR